MFFLLCIRVHAIGSTYNHEAQTPAFIASICRPAYFNAEATAKNNNYQKQLYQVRMILLYLFCCTSTVDLAWEPTWDKDMMSEEAKLELGFM